MMGSDAFSQPTARAPEPATRSRSRRIIVVDDAPEMRALLRDVLEYAGYEVIPAASGARAMTIMAQLVPDLVISDLLMPGMTGFSLRAAMLRTPRLAQVPVIVLSAYWQRPGETLEAGAVLSKPLNVDHLLDAVRRLLPADDAVAST